MDDEELTKNLMSRGISSAWRIAKMVGGRLFRKIASRIFAALMTVLAPYIVFLLLFILIFGFIYFALFMLPRYIAEGSNVPAVIYNYGKQDLWKLSQDVALVKKYRKLDYDWLHKFESYETLAYKRPDSISGNGADPDATVSSVWGSYMGTSLSSPFNIPAYSTYDKIFQDKAKKYKLDVKLLKSVAYAESGFNPRAVSLAGCVGIMRLSDAKIQEYGIKDPFNPEENIDGGARYLSELIARFKSIELAVAAYNAGPGAVEQYGGIPPFPETVSYVRKVMSGYRYGGFVTPSLNAGCNIVAEQEQVEPHRVPWALMGAMDRILGDPIVTGRHGLETEGKGRYPEPEKHFKELEPVLEWKDFELYYYHRWVVTSEEDTKTYTEKYKHNIRLLVSAGTYEANYSYDWDAKIIERGGEDNYTKIIIPELKGVERTGPYYERLKNIVRSYGLIKDSNVELILRIAMNTDPVFNADANLTSSLLELTGNTEMQTYRGGTGELSWPASGPITSPFGYRVHPITGRYRFHSGIDVGIPSGTEVRSAGDGVVVYVGWNGGYGKCVIVDHGKYRTLYGHLGSYKVKVGDEVKKGDVIALSDNTGDSTGPHLHFEVRTGVNKTDFVDPLSILR